MFILTKKSIRPSTNVEFYATTNEYLLHFKSTYVVSGKIISSVKEISDDQLTLTMKITWDSMQSYLDYNNDPVCFDLHTIPSRLHDKEQGIITSVSVNDGEFSQNGTIWKHYNSTEYFSGMPIPDSWDTLEDFVDWYLEQRMPLMVPWDAEVIRSDDAVAICIFRKGNYQVEFYLEYPNMYIRPHAHPRMEVITMDLGGGKLGPREQNGVSKIWGQSFSKLLAGEFHGGDATTSTTKGFVTLAFQRWENPEEMTSAAVQWKGELQGPYQEELIKRKKPNAEVISNYADVTLDTSVSKD